jgi:phage terminase large subunit-like protein
MIDLWLEEAEAKLARMPDKAQELRETAMNDLYTFACLVNPGYMYGQIHREIFKWLEDYSMFGTDTTLTANKLIMLPRGHLKSHMVATWCAWVVTRHPEITILYLSATAELAQTQLIAIQNIFESRVYQRYFPEYVHPKDGKREKWTAFKITIDHVKRKQEGIRDATIATAGLTTNTTGWHADVIIADDLVVPENAYTEDGRDSVVRKASQFTSIRNPGGFTLACGTRYHPRDVYAIWKDQVYDVYTDEGELVDKQSVWEVSEHVVEEDGFFIWPRQVRDDGKAFGFDWKVLSRIKAEYEDRTQFHAQYYNNPNDPESDRISRSKFQYANRRLLTKEGDRWFYNKQRLNVYAAIDFAFSHSKAADWTAIVVIGVDAEGNIYVLDIDRFKTDKTLVYFQHIAKLHSDWHFKMLRAEVTVAQKVIVTSIKDYLKTESLRLPIDEFRPSRADGSKEERIAAVLEPKYDNMRVWHFEGGWTAALEEELIHARPKHDDIKDAMAAAVSIAIAPKRSIKNTLLDFIPKTANSNRFGGVPYR